MANLDLNLLTSLDGLLAEGAVEGAARRLGLSASAMNRTLGDYGRRPGIRCSCTRVEAWCRRRTPSHFANACVIGHGMPKPCCVPSLLLWIPPS